MSALPLETHLSPQEYLLRERATREGEAKSEYLNGIMIAMAGGSYRHNLVAANLLAELTIAFKKRSCVTLGSDMKVWIEKANVFRYPDISAVCGPLDFYDEVQDTYRNPQLIVEVLSPGTEQIDRGEKFALYKLLPSLTEYLLVCQDRPEMELHRRCGGTGSSGDRWTGEIYKGVESRLSLESVGVDLCASDVFAKVEFGLE